MAAHQVQQFIWLEPLSYAWVCGRVSIRKVFLVAALLWLLLMFLVLALTAYTAQTEIEVDVSLALFIAVFCIAATWLVSRMPRNVHVDDKSIWIGRTMIPHSRISSAGVEPVVIGGKSYSILRLRTVNGSSYSIGLSHSVNAVNLAGFLQSSGIKM